MPIAVLVLAGALIVYVLFGYPVLLGFLARRSERPVRKARLRKRVSIILAVRDGERWIARKLETLAALDYPQELIEILVVSDGSTDGLPRLSRRLLNPTSESFVFPRAVRPLRSITPSAMRLARFFSSPTCARLWSRQACKTWSTASPILKSALLAENSSS